MPAPETSPTPIPTAGEPTAPTDAATSGKATQQVVSTSGPRSVAVGRNLGVVQTGDGARVVAGVSMGSPAAVPAPLGGLVELPKPPRRIFVGRDDSLAELDRLVSAGAGVVAQALHGLGGVGKTELAVQYATRHRARYELVWWVTADSPEAIEVGLAELAFRLHPDTQIIAEPGEAARWALAWLQSHDRWLLVLDNVEDRAHVEPLMGRVTRGHVLITTRRDAGWDDITDGCLRLDVLTPDAAVTLLSRQTGIADLGGAAALANELGCLPLALQQAAAYLRQTRISIDEYLRRLRADPAAVLAAVGAGDSAQRAVARTWSVTIDAIARENPLAARVMDVLACVAPDDLPRDVLTPIDPDGVDQALGVLASYNMVTLTEAAITVHRLVQTVTLTRLRQPRTTPPPRPDGGTGPADNEPGGTAALPAHGLTDALRTAIALLSRATADTDPEDLEGWPLRAALSPHVAALAERCDDDTGGQALGRLFTDAGHYEWRQARYTRALECTRRALAIAEATLGPDHPDTAGGLDHVAVSLRALGRIGEAEGLQRWAVAITEVALGPDHPHTARRLNNLALTLVDLGRAGEAEGLQRRALAITEAALGPDHPHTANRLNNLALSLGALGRVEEAERLQRRALAITEATLGPDHPLTATNLANLALTLVDLGRPGEAEGLHRRALTITEAALGPDHPETASSLDNLALSLRALGRAGEAEGLHRRALAITEAALGPDHPDAAIPLDNLALTLTDLGRADEAETVGGRVPAITGNELGQPPEVAAAHGVRGAHADRPHREGLL